MDRPAHESAASLAAAIRAGDIDAVERIVVRSPELIAGFLGGTFGTRTALHVVVDWPGYLPNGPQIVRLLVAAGADPDGRAPGEETPLHWAASNDDADVAAALIDGGADVDASGGSIGTPLENAIGYCCWHVAALLAARGARVEKLWHAAALGHLGRVQELIESRHPTSGEVSQAFWHACSAGRRRAAEHLLAVGAELDWVPDYAEGTPLDAASIPGTGRENLIGWLRERGARSAVRRQQ